MTMPPARKLLISGGVMLAAILSLLLYQKASSLEKEHEHLQSQRDELLLLKKDYSEIRDRVNSIERKKSLTKSEGIAQAADEVFRSLGLSRNVKSLKSTGTQEREFGLDEEAEIQVERVTMNELVNIFYKIEHAQAVLSVRKASLRTSFDNPSLINITMTVGFIRPK